MKISSCNSPIKQAAFPIYRRLIPLAIGSAAASAFAADNIPTLYGKVNLTLNQYHYERFANATTSYTAQDNWKMESNSSRIGVKGDYPISDAIKVVYKLEYEIFADSDKQGDNGSDFKQRSTYAGLQGNWGTLFAGKNDTPLKAISAENVQVFKDMPLADYKYFMVGEDRENNIIQYATPSLSGFVLSGLIEPGEDSGAHGSNGATVTTHTNHSLVNKYSVAALYKFGSVYFALADNRNIQNSNTLRAAFQYGIGAVTLSGLWQKAERNYATVPNTAGTALQMASLGTLSNLPVGNNNSAFNPITDFSTF